MKHKKQFKKESFGEFIGSALKGYKNKMRDDELIDRVARLWMAGGGDTTGMLKYWSNIIDRIEVLEKEDVQYLATGEQNESGSE